VLHYLKKSVSQGKQMIEYLISHFSYTILFFWSFLEGEIGLALAGFMIAKGRFDFPTVFLITFSGAMIGDLLLFGTGRLFKQKTETVLHRYDKKLRRGEKWFRHFGSWIIVFERFIYGTHIPALLMMGVSGFNFWKFFLLEIVGVALWSVTFTSLGYYFGQTVINLLTFTQRHLTITFLVLLFFYIVYQLQKEEDEK